LIYSQYGNRLYTGYDVIIVTRHIRYEVLVRATQRTKHASPQNDTTKTRTLEVRQRICKNRNQDGKRKKPEEFDKIHWVIWNIGH
jgi:hypothetical protein